MGLEHGVAGTAIAKAAIATNITKMFMITYNLTVVTLAPAGIIKTFTQQQTYDPANCLTDQTALREGRAYHRTLQQLFVQ
jgi:hypothetical protein